jgi:sortase A
VGRIEMPRLGLRAVVHEGIDGRTLLRAVGHIPGTAFPGTHGTVGLAAHRDSYFRALKDAREGDELFVTTPSGRIRYVVHDTRIVQPADVWVLEPTPQESVTLVTCYPFSYVGVAPERFVVRARREDATLRSSAIQAESGDRGTARSAVPMSAVAAGEGPPSQVRAAKKRAVRLSAGRPPDSASAAKGQKKPKGSNRGFWKTLLSVLT